MRFTLIDRITHLREGHSITAVKALSLAEEYLQDHFPRFPVMPGVLMLESMFQASAWLVRKTDDFAYSSLMLEEARNVKYADFVEPGQCLTVKADVVKCEDRTTTLKTQGLIGDHVAVSARLVLRSSNLAEIDPAHEPLDRGARRELRRVFQQLYGSTPLETAR